ncbi:hypothetical protein [Pyxidicoccus caerfyrddinensis]|uniref:hypothetical protein n=1 Tax=Pyxidicoccus caerfyrddinensis TaxID=2709663 RepID=UPI0013D957DD|nr:hypothetical protein [Pyxidicoccus caerfyrddinensis]
MGTDHEGQLRITGPVTEDHTVPAEVLVRTLEGMQQTAWLLAASREGLEVHQRFKPSADFRKRYTLRCALPQPGSYAVPMDIGEGIPSFPEPVHAHGLLNDIYTLWDAVARGSFEQVKNLVPDSAYRQRLLQETKKLLPKRGDAWGLALTAKNRDQEIILGPKAMPALEQWTDEQWLSTPEERRETTSVIGQMVRIDFSERKVVILYPPTQKEVDCVYLPQVEERLLEARRGLFQVTGYFVVDEEGHPKKLMEVSNIEPVDLSPMTFVSIEHDGQEYSLSPPLVLTPSLDEESQQYFVAEHPELHVMVHGRTREKLADELAEQLAFLWREYVETDPSTLADDALQLRQDLSRRVSRKNG